MKKFEKYKYIIWDFDGTINNTSPGIYATFSAVLKHFGIDASGMDLSEHIGPPLEYSYTKLVGEANCSKAIDLHRKVFAESNAAQNSFLYDGIVDVLDKLLASGKFVMSIASSKYEPHAVESLQYLKLSKYFTYVYGQTERRGYKADVLRQLIDDNGFDRSHCLMIGDTLHDVQGAVDNGIDVVGVTYGFGKKQDLLSNRTVAIVDSPSQIADLLLG